jgi:hypothetical protein
MHGSYKWFMLLLLSLAFFFSQSDRVLFGLLFWSAMTAATGLVGGICGMIFFRSVLTGGGDGLRTVNPYVSGDTRHKPLFGKIPRPPRLSSITHQQKGTRQWCAKQSSAELAEWCAK